MQKYEKPSAEHVVEKHIDMLRELTNSTSMPPHKALGQLVSARSRCITVGIRPRKGDHLAQTWVTPALLLEKNTYQETMALLQAAVGLFKATEPVLGVVSYMAVSLLIPVIDASELTEAEREVMERITGEPMDTDTEDMAVSDGENVKLQRTRQAPVESEADLELVERIRDKVRRFALVSHVLDEDIGEVMTVVSEFAEDDAALPVARRGVVSRTLGAGTFDRFVKDVGEDIGRFLTAPADLAQYEAADRGDAPLQ